VHEVVTGRVGNRTKKNKEHSSGRRVLRLSIFVAAAKRIDGR
jgi:hypothetical protein